jgi:predicted kinase
VGPVGRTERDELRERARELGVAVELRYLAANVAVVWDRVQARGMDEAAGSRAIEREELVQWVAHFETPDDEELRLFDPPTI